MDLNYPGNSTSFESKVKITGKIPNNNDNNNNNNNKSV